MKYTYDPEEDVLVWLDEEPEPSPVPGVSRERYEECVFWIRRARRLSPIDLVEENQQRLDFWRDMERVG